MAISTKTIRLSDELRVFLSGIADDTTREFVAAWARAWDVLEYEWGLAIADLVTANKNGKWPSRRQIMQAERAQAALDSTYRQILALTELQGVRVVTAARRVATETAFWHARILASQVPEVGVDVAQLIAGLRTVDEYALAQLVERVQGDITSRLKPLPDFVVEEIRRALIRGTAAGDNPRKVADDMVRQVRGRYNLGLTRALTIARTEILDAYRGAAQVHELDHVDVMAGWLWHAKLDTRTCPSCWAQHGQLHDVGEPGPYDHPQGRCVRIPKLKSWEDLGFEDLDEPDDETVDAQTAFDALTREEQLAIMGPVRLRALQLGQITWEDLSRLQHNTGWRDSYVVTPFKELRRKMLRPVP